MNKGIALLTIAIAALGAYFVLRSPAPVTEEAQEVKEEIDQEEEVEELSIETRPAKVLQGDPVEIVVKGVEDPSEVESLEFNGKKLVVFTEENEVMALIGIDLRAHTGKFPIVLTLKDGQVVRSELNVGARTIATAPLGIPDKLGGNTPQSEQTLVNTLVEEGRIISAVPSGPEKLWEGKFVYPVAEPVTITDVYGYSRQTGGSSISHKGTDFRAPVGTPVYAMNSGRVAYVDYLRNYGNTIIVDHGLGLHTIYMHLSEVEVKVGDMVSKGQEIAKSGDTGYVLGPHLHLTIRIGGISIDPEKFIELFN